MRNLLHLFAATMLLTGQVADIITSPPAVPARAEAQAVEAKTNISFNTNQADPLDLVIERPNFDAEVLAPLRAAQAKQATAAARPVAIRRTAVTTTTVRTSSGYISLPATPEAWLKLRFCESGNLYDRNSGNGYYGAYQFDIRTWGNWMGYARPDLAPPAVQDAKAQETYSRRGWTPWPSCAKKLGLLVPA